MYQVSVVREREYTNNTAYPYTRIRVYFCKRRGQIQSFLVKLEYNTSENTALMEQWEGVARPDHNPHSDDGHDIRNEGLHMDIRDPDGTERRSYDFPNVPVNQAPRWCEEYVKENQRTPISSQIRRSPRATPPPWRTSENERWCDPLRHDVPGRSPIEYPHECGSRGDERRPALAPEPRCFTFSVRITDHGQYN